MFSITKGRKHERDRYTRRLEYRRKMHPASGPVVSLVVLAALFAVGPAAVVCASLGAVGLSAAWYLTKRTGPSTKPTVHMHKTSTTAAENYARRRND